jgi:hypothetical protein
MRPKTFIFQGQEYEYWRDDPGERIIEVPIFWSLVMKYEPTEILEIGNVLNHYPWPDRIVFASPGIPLVSHTVVDKYEKAHGVVNEDVVVFNQGKKYKLIISISTLEHIGTFEDPPEDHTKIQKALSHLKTLLIADGKLIVTLPLGFNLIMDRQLREETIKFDKRHCMKKISADNEWIESAWNDIKDTKYNDPFPAANGLVIGEIEG